jgi:hypothetical protein
MHILIKQAEIESYRFTWNQYGFEELFSKDFSLLTELEIEQVAKFLKISIHERNPKSFFEFCLEILHLFCRSFFAPHTVPDEMKQKAYESYPNSWRFLFNKENSLIKLKVYLNGKKVFEIPEFPESKFEEIIRKINQYTTKSFTFDKGMNCIFYYNSNGTFNVDIYKKILSLQLEGQDF